ncbi:23S rRNA (adenine2030-N6)-methyltransferase [Microbulbifer donghaiensis]|uniref:Ribosomal RNA large subunit methyltransferase J n=1 Tax=Microbulbifer donghaiensis TaxID=494016 RepID=A0A1M4W2B1_9GAMM|nr:23S rRNA (adenine(2030)-N(6))-methyltransferase RlmJ [Microbulbifer donghaiensis]SHE75356.1 23S rRNA (adenine2030-N6)-methyltransferase [Microbulbifer donghaiensis]
MLSYRHGFHAGNFADVLKHLVQVEILTYLQKKDKPLDYIDTHAGAGLYRLRDALAAKNCEYANGIGRLLPGDPGLPALRPYLKQVLAHNPAGPLQVYPGSPAIACGMLRPQDKAWLYELHPSDVEQLRRACSGRNVYIRDEDGFKGLAALLPTPSRRALVLIDPPYELKQDYQRVVDALKLIHRKMPTATVALWYPVVERRRIDQLEQQIIASGIRRVEQFELGICADTDGHGMTASGMIVVNPPWTLKATMDELLPSLARLLSEDGREYLRIQTLVGE